MALFTENSAPLQGIRRVHLGGVHVRNTREPRNANNAAPNEFFLPQRFVVELLPDMPIVTIAEHPQNLDIDTLREIICAASSISIPDSEVAIIMPNGLTDSCHIESPDWVTAQLLEFYVQTHKKGFTIHQHIGDLRALVQIRIPAGEIPNVSLTSPSLDA